MHSLALHLIMHRAPLPIIEWTLRRTGSDLRQALVLSISQSNAQMLSLLKGIPNGFPTMDQLIAMDDPDIVHQHNSFILLAKDSDTLRILLERGYDPNISDTQRLRTASSRGETEVVEMLLEHGANVHVNDDGPLIYACTNGYTEIVRSLIRHGANVRVNEDTPLLTAITYGHYDIVKLLLDAGADPKARDGEMLRMARRKWDHRLINLLKEVTGEDDIHVPQAERRALELMQDSGLGLY
jgi:hypothetical protein